MAPPIAESLAIVAVVAVVWVGVLVWFALVHPRVLRFLEKRF